MTPWWPFPVRSCRVSPSPSSKFQLAKALAGVVMGVVMGV
jgi:hypothetical protein